jgi:CO/xanthine dehydrogenase Mo-binding subunit
MEKIILVLALTGSVMYLFDKLTGLLWKRKGNVDVQAQQTQVAEAIRSRDGKIAELQGRIRVLEVQLSAAREQAPSALQQVQQEIASEPIDPLAAIMRDAEEKAVACLVESKRFAMAAIEATGREKSRLLAEAKTMADKAAEYRAVANRELPVQQDQVKAQAKAVIEKAKRADEQHLSKRLKQDELARERAKFELLDN